jgi:hypothetical protein
MRLRLVAGCGAIAAGLGVACGGRTTDVGSPASPVQEGGPEASATDDAGSPLDATVTLDAGTAIDFDANAVFEGGGLGILCYLPQPPLPWNECAVALPPTDACAPSEYEWSCGTVVDASTPPVLGCAPEPGVFRGRYCCPCGAADAGGEACIGIDLSTYDRSCQTDSDCMSIPNPVCQDCNCDNDAINVDGRDRFNATLARLPPAMTLGGCGCNFESGPKCVQGVCTSN